MGEKAPGTGWSQQDRQRGQRAWGSNKPVFREAQGGTAVRTGELAVSVGAGEMGKQVGLGHKAFRTTGKGWGCRGLPVEQAGF